MPDRKSDYKELLKRAFLDATSKIESSGGKDFSHADIESGIHAGSRAMGSYGLMPNTIKEMRKRYPNWEPYQELEGLPDKEIIKRVEADKELDKDVAEPLADYVLSKYKDPRVANYAWQWGQNTPVDKAENEVMFPVNPAAIERDRKFQKYFRPPMQPESLEARDRKRIRDLERTFGPETQEEQLEIEDSSSVPLASLRKYFK